jgi:hypothetical protein
MRRAAAALALAAAAAGHQYHASRTEAEWNSRTQRVELVASLHIDDLEELLRAETGRHIELDRDREAESLVCAYTARRIEFRGAAGEPFALRCVGIKVMRHFVEVYAEAYAAGGVVPKRMRNAILTERLADQVNQVLWRRGGAPAGPDLLFTRQKEWMDLPR